MRSERRGLSSVLSTALNKFDSVIVARTKKIYAAYLGLIKLSETPFQVAGIRPVWESFFNSRTCISDNKRLLKGHGILGDFRLKPSSPDIGKTESIWKPILGERIPEEGGFFVLE